MKNILLIVMMGMGLMAHSQFNKRMPDYNFIDKIMYHAKWQTTQDVTYDGSYRIIDYPNGDVPSDIGVCTDVIIRAYRYVGYDFQESIHRSIIGRMDYYYPVRTKNYGDKPDSNIDHRRVRIIKKYLDLHWPESRITDIKDYQPGDILFWDNWHIGILIDEKVPGTDRYYCVHNIGMGPVKGDVHYDEEKLEHFRFRP
jgi:hypothetical protein